MTETFFLYCNNRLILSNKNVQKKTCSQLYNIAGKGLYK